MSSPPPLTILLIGNGGREHALAWKLSQSAAVQQIYVAPGNAGTSQCDKCANIDISVSNFDALVEFAVKNNVNLAIPGPEQPLVDGIELHFRKVGIPVFGPEPEAAQLEGSKAFSKLFMDRHNIPTAKYGTFSTFEEAKQYLDSVDHKVVIKADGLAAGKGVLIPENKDEALKGLEEVMVTKAFGDAGNQVVIEEFLEGQELSVLAFCDGYTVLPLPGAQDHKRIGDGDSGPNTGGMGTYAPTPIATQAVNDEIALKVLRPTLAGMRKDGMPFVGLLFVGLMLTLSGVKVLEYNVRFGDPETQSLMALMSPKSDLAAIIWACVRRRLDSITIEMQPACAVTVVIASEGYPGDYPKGRAITFKSTPSNVNIFHAGTSLKDGQVVTAGGRVLAVTAVAPTIRQAVDLAYKGVECVSFEGMQYRKDIAHRALNYQKEKSAGLTYADAGVSIDEGNRLVEEIKAVVKSTARPGADSEIGGFGGAFDLKAAGYTDPILVSGTDGIGTKLKIAHAMDQHDTIGIDLVAMSVNDLVVQGAEPLYFLDYFACSTLEVNVASDFVKGVAKGCRDSGCALIGGETAEMPGIYAKGDYDAAGFAVGAVERTKLLPRNDITPGDVLIGIRSSGPHSNGYSLIRKVLSKSNMTVKSPCPWDDTRSIGDVLLEPTQLYIKQLLPAFKQDLIKALSHITGGGFTDNVPRMLPKNLGAHIDLRAWKLPQVFEWLRSAGGIASEEMVRTFNCGIGMVGVVESGDVDKALEVLNEEGHAEAFVIGAVTDKAGPLWLRAECKEFEARAALTPTTAKKLIEHGFSITVERDSQRIFDDSEYSAVGCTLAETGSWPDAPLSTPIIGLKELPEADTPLEHTHVMFAHCYKQQSGWRQILNRFKQGSGTLYDLEFLQDEAGRRVAAFGYHAGFAGSAVGCLALAAQVQGEGKLDHIKPYPNEGELVKQVREKFSVVEKKLGRGVRALVIGALGRCGRGAVDFLKAAGVKDEDILKWDMAETAKGGPFQEILDVDIFVNCIYLNSKIPHFVTAETIKAAGEKRKLACVVDVSCDTTNPNNPIPIYNINTTFDKPTVDVPTTEGPRLTVCSIDHLPTLLPREASEAFSNDLLPSLLELPNRKTARVWTEAENLYKTKLAEVDA